MFWQELGCSEDALRKLNSQLRTINRVMVHLKTGQSSWGEVDSGDVAAGWHGCGDDSSNGEV